MTRHTSVVFLIAALCMTALTACRRAELSGPPTLRIGHDECAECGMLLSEDRCAGAMLVDTSSGRAHLVFDDIGCLLDYRDAEGHPAPIEAFVKDYGDRTWLPAANAWFVVGGPDAPQTPMGSGIVAFGSKEAADAQKARSGGKVVDYAHLAAARLEWHESRRPSPPGAP